MHARIALTALVAAGLLAASPAVADVVDVDLTGWQATGDWGSELNSWAMLNIGGESQVTGAEWIDLEFTTADDSWRSELVLSLNTVGGAADFWDSTVTDLDSPGTYSGSGTFPGPATAGGPFTVDPEGRLYIEVYDSFEAGTLVDATISTGTLRVHYTAVPEPAALGTLAFAGGLLLRRRR